MNHHPVQNQDGVVLQWGVKQHWLREIWLAHTLPTLVDAYALHG